MKRTDGGDATLIIVSLYFLACIAAVVIGVMVGLAL